MSKRPPAPIRFLVFVAAFASLALAVCSKQRTSEQRSTTPPVATEPQQGTQPPAESNSHSDGPAPQALPAPADAGAAQNPKPDQQEEFFPASKSAGPFLR